MMIPQAITFKNTVKAILLCVALLILSKKSYSQVSWDKAAFHLSCKEAENNWKPLILNGQKFRYCFLAKEYKDTSEKGIDNFEGIILLDIDKKTTDSLTAWKICELVSKKIKIDKFIVFRTCEANKIYSSSTGPRNESEKQYLIDNTFGTYTRTKD
ncbi:hypothetical protein [Pedobacter frigiditerrae]|uniref:hypothetical protein n=1 Tax=Pedobacter frigiditerrae TaxID=2530452 RepID=UPI00292CBCF3|nr:hypothetical protein [Pedobacter frigiditerrae]